MVLAQELEVQGWTRQFTIEVERADEYAELYESLGDEVRVELVTPDLIEALRPAQDAALRPAQDAALRLAQDVAEECATCLLAACDEYVVIYTRPKE